MASAPRFVTAPRLHARPASRIYNAWNFGELYIHVMYNSPEFGRVRHKVGMELRSEVACPSRSEFWFERPSTGGSKSRREREA
jgi:hypothetical protein